MHPPGRVENTHMSSREHSTSSYVFSEEEFDLMVLGLGVSFVTSKASTYPPVREIGKPLTQLLLAIRDISALIPGTGATTGKGRLNVMKLDCHLGMCWFEKEMPPPNPIGSCVQCSVLKRNTVLLDLEIPGGGAWLEELA